MRSKAHEVNEKPSCRPLVFKLFSTEVCLRQKSNLESCVQNDLVEAGW